MADNSADTIPIPGPPGLPLVGNALEIEAELPLRTFQTFAEQYGKSGQPGHTNDVHRCWLTGFLGDIYRLNLPSGTTIVVVSPFLPACALLGWC